MSRIVWAAAGIAGFAIAAALFIIVAVSYQKLQADVERANLALARAEDLKAALEDTITSLEGTSNDIAKAFQTLCPADRSGLSTERLNTCSSLSGSMLSGSTDLDHLALRTAYDRATVARVTAQSEADFEQAAAAYEKLLPLAEKLGTPENRRMWSYHIYEGMAYVQWRRATSADEVDPNYLALAKSNVIKAQELDPERRSGVVGLTYLKILCSEPAPDFSQIETYYRDLGASLERHKSEFQGRSATDVENKEATIAAITLERFRQDREIRLVCGQANLKPV